MRFSDVARKLRGGVLSLDGVLYERKGNAREAGESNGRWGERETEREKEKAMKKEGGRAEFKG